MAIIRIGVDLAKNVFARHGVDESGRCSWLVWSGASSCSTSSLLYPLV